MNEDLDTSIFPNYHELRQFAEARGVTVSRKHPPPPSLVAAWDKAHPDRPYVHSHRFHGTSAGRYFHRCSCARCINGAREAYRNYHEASLLEKGIETVPQRGRRVEDVPMGTERPTVRPKAAEHDGYALDLSDGFGSIRRLEAFEIRAASLKVCQFAKDADDATVLLQALGLVEPAL